MSRPPAAPRLVFLDIDIDGTLTNERGDIPASAAAAIAEARSRGHLVFLATGRSPLEIDPRVDALGFDGLVAGAGAYVLFEGDWIVENELTEEQTRRVAGILDELGLDYSLQGRRGVYPTAGHRARMQRVLASFGYTRADMENSGVRLHVLDPGEIRYDHAAKIVFDGDAPSAYDLVTARLGEEYVVVGGTLPGLGTASGEISPRGVHKAAAIEVLAERLGRTMADTVAVGDSGNDIEMLRACGVGVAMGNGTDAAKAAADFVTDAVEDDGLRNAFLRLALIAPEKLA
ncbi:HAD family hydrolase [Microbacterium sp. cx-59]|uniref:HAD family hydrolase n=1 Tax=Microbacterium sp. cx-59 TaxID=2891207 RepID=UPI001E366FAD|nr:HAD family hydrolase [Microbacterium sp. cx-59]MCC4909228.1 HAD family hydrolase [Microbacterium sp. cx-59]